MLNYLKSLIQSGTMNSSKSFSLIVSVLVGAAIGLCICFALILDVCRNGYLMTNLNDLGVLILCVGGYIAGGGVNKAISENSENRAKKDCTKE